MLSEEQNKRLTSVGPGTPGGELLRRYWHPVGSVSEMQKKHTQKVRILGENLLLYRDRSGNYGLIEPQCPHRRMNLIYGIPEEHGLRCPYHGWLFDEAGRCTEQPYEETEDAEGRFKDKIHMTAYPVQVMAGIIFAYMGPQPAPLLPRWDVYVAGGFLRDIGYAELNCNWLQIQENTLDPVHAEWLHFYWGNYLRDKLDRPDDEMKLHQRHARIGFDEFEYGMIKRRYFVGGSEDDPEWKEGHPMVFPNILRQGGPAFGGVVGPAFQVRVPIDDTHTAHWYITCYPKGESDPEQRDEEVPFYRVPVPDLDEEGQPRWDLLLNSNSQQDGAAWVTQGEVTDRTRENLGRSDKGIIMFRQMLERNIRMVEDGADPINTFRNPEDNVFLELHTEHTPFYVAVLSQRQGQATAFSPILNSRSVANR